MNCWPRVGWMIVVCLAMAGCDGGDEVVKPPAAAPAQPAAREVPPKLDRPAPSADRTVASGAPAKVDGLAGPPLTAEAVHAGRAAALRYLPKDAFAALLICPQQAVGSPVFKDLPWDKLLEGPTKQSGIDLKTVEQVYLFIRTPEGGLHNFRQPIMVTRFVEPIDAEAIVKRQFRGYETVVGGESKYYVEKDGLSVSPTVLVAIDERTIAYGNHADLRPLIEARPAVAPLAGRVQAAPDDAVLHAVVLFEPIRGLLEDAMKQAREKGPAPLKQFTELPELLSGLTATVKLDGGTLAELSLEGKDEVSAKRTQELVDQAVALGRLAYAGVRLQAGSSVPEHLKPALAVADEAMTGLKVEKQATTVAVRVPTPKSIGKLAEMALPAIADARSRAQQAQAQVNLRQIAMAIKLYEQAHGKYPTDVYSADGQPLLSWRVAILPYLSEVPRLEGFRRDEPWDSEHNRKLLEKMPTAYRSELAANAGTHTVLQRFSGKGTSLDGPKGLTTGQLTDGAAHTLLVVVAGADKAVPWTKPADLPFDAMNPIAALGAVPPTGLLVSFHDGNVRILSRATPPNVLKALITPDGKEQVDLNRLPSN